MVFNDLSHHRYAVMALNPICAFNIVIQGVQELLIESWRLLELAVVDVRHFNWAVSEVHWAKFKFLSLTLL